MFSKLFDILKGMFTPYVEPPKTERIEPTINEPIQLGDGTSPGSGAGQASPAGIIPPPLGQAPPESENKFNYIVRDPSKLLSEDEKRARRLEAERGSLSRSKRRSRKVFNPVVRNSRGDVNQSHTSYGHDDGGSSSCSSSSSDSGGGSCGGGGGE